MGIRQTLSVRRLGNVAGGPLRDARHAIFLAATGADLLRGVEILLAHPRTGVTAQVLGAQTSEFHVGLSLDTLDLLLELLGSLHKGIEVHDLSSQRVLLDHLPLGCLLLGWLLAAQEWPPKDVRVQDDRHHEAHDHQEQGRAGEQGVLDDVVGNFRIVPALVLQYSGVSQATDDQRQRKAATVELDHLPEGCAAADGDRVLVGGGHDAGSGHQMVH